MHSILWLCFSVLHAVFGYFVLLVPAHNLVMFPHDV